MGFQDSSSKLSESEIEIWVRSENETFFLELGVGITVAGVLPLVVVVLSEGDWVNLGPRVGGGPSKGLTRSPIMRELFITEVGEGYRAT